MNLQLLTRRQAIGEWRDRQIIAASNLLNRAAQESRAGFEAQIGEASFTDMLWDPESFAHGRIDAQMRKHLDGSIAQLLVDAATELRMIADTFGELATALQDSTGHVVLPLADQEDPPGSAPIAAAADNQASTDVGQSTSSANDWSSYLADTAIARGTRAWSVWAADALVKASDSAGLAIKDRTGLHDRLRFVAGQRLATAWFGRAATSRPVLGQLISLIDDVTSSARNQMT